MNQITKHKQTIITFALPKPFMEVLNKLKEMNYIVSKSEFIRKSVVNQLQEELIYIKSIVDPEFVIPEYIPKYLYEIPLDQQKTPPMTKEESLKNHPNHLSPFHSFITIDGKQWKIKGKKNI